jgi:hypothetical protein
MEFWTFLVITLGAPYDGYVSALPYRSIAECNAAMEVVADTMRSVPVEMVQCIESSKISKSQRPKPNPFYEAG